ncbi:MAG: hypothetical protein AAFR74_05085 [Pseudomonadota bacterium]
MAYLTYGLPILWGIILLAMIYFAISGRKTPLGFSATLFLCIYVLSVITLPTPWVLLAGPFIVLQALSTPYWYVLVVFILLLAVVSVLTAFNLKRSDGSFIALLSFMTTTALFYAGFSAYLAYKIPRAQAAVNVEIVCQSRKSTLNILTSGLRERGRPHALIRTEDDAYIYSFGERRFVEIPPDLARKTSC